ncbi:hypothetical protein ACU610_08080 [Geodermatophilus sp. URMC 61]|uniref:hypothetical protein n=1 Tax=Geodermatophilus sp. URMC 61 TaxID=3423411 RepID=UPI00406D14C3
MVDDPSAALLIRVWLEGSTAFRARLLSLRTAAPGTPPEEVTVAVTSSTEDVLDAVRTWLDGFTGNVTDSTDGSG